ncbi:acyltransferase domain-containing protein [Micromonospora sp. HNM0581]|uniref:type I polyketide synthase n=1 Tax=Micromonospora sp. HNM0581 TaxID=2716341 RepID=UPI00146A63E9|nr:type I polyketide synthase [Micromonospora sp. HNM0581]NLU79287.1 acyltransferase domain-containing protein [Micromonospora sp. HNM0581]
MVRAGTDVAVIGMSCRFPGVPGLPEFWRLLVEGGSTVAGFPEHRLAGSQVSAHPDAATLMTGSFLDAIDGFDAVFFGTAAAEAAAMDPTQRLGLELAWEAVEDARIPASALAGREIDVVVSTAPCGYDQLRKLSGSDRDDHYAAIGSSGAMIANRISGLFDVRGMSFCADSGQSSSLLSLALACDRIGSGAVDMAITGGVHLVTDPEAGTSLANLGALSPDGRCFTFDDRANGFVRGEGGAIVVLKRLDLAVDDGDHVYAVVRGWGVASGGASSRMPDPSPSGQAAATSTALDRAAIAFRDIGYVEAHGTGTRLGDPAELAGLRELCRQAGRTWPLAIGSVKTNVGHLEPAAGIVGFVKAALCVDRGRLVPSLNFRSNTTFADFARYFEVVPHTRPWPGQPGRPRRAGVSAFGMGGTTVHVILEQAPEPPPAPAATATVGTLPWVISARSAEALPEQAARLRTFVSADPSLSAADVAQSLVSTRSMFAHRAVVLGADREALLAGLDLVANGKSTPQAVRGVVSDPVGPTVFVFPGQGSQWQGMGRQLYAESEVFARAIDDCHAAFEPWLDWSLVEVVTGAGSAATLDRIDVIQPALFAMMVSLARVWRSMGVVPDAVVGHSQGEIAAAYDCGAISLDDAARIVSVRSRAMAALSGCGGMSAVSAPLDWVRDRLARSPGRLSVAAVNGPSSVVVSGEASALDEFAELAAAEDVQVRRVKVDLAGHSHHLDPLRERLLDSIAGVTSRESSVRFYSTVTGGLFDTRELDSAHWYANLRSMVRFGEVIEHLMPMPGTVFVEVSPHPVLQLALAETADALSASPLLVGTLSRNEGGLGQVLSSLAELHVRGLPVDWTAAWRGSGARRITLPTYAFHRQRYWLTADDTATSLDPRAPGDGPCVDSESSALSLVCAAAAAMLSTKNPPLTQSVLIARSAQSFRDLGFDSAMVVGLRNRLAALTGLRLPATVGFTHPTPQALARHLFSLVEPPEPDTPAEGESLDDRADDELFALVDRGYL